MPRLPRGDRRPFARRQVGTTSWSPDRCDVVELLLEAQVDACGLIPWGSNYTFLITLEHPTEGSSYAVYKPRRGEAPLGDFPDGTLYRRERAAYLVSQALGWDLVPPTVIRDGPHGIGMVQLFIEADPHAHYFTFGPTIPDISRQIALFDIVVNNTDRKAGHLLRALDGKVWAIDHGLTFHSTPKLRTVIWDFAGEAIQPALVSDLGAIATDWERSGGPLAELPALLSARECQALRYRVERLIDRGRFPEPTSYRSMPWPAV